MWGMAICPIVLLLYLMVVRNWPTVRASAAGAFSALAIGIFVFGAPVECMAVETFKGLWSSISIIVVIIPAILIYEISRETQAFAAIQVEMSRLVPDPLLRLLALGWCFPSFLQGPSGFGVPIAVAAPLLICIGVKPFWSVLIPLMAHAWGNTFGTLGLGWDALVQQTSLVAGTVAYWKAALWSGAFTGFMCMASGFLICIFYNGLKGLAHGLPAVLILGTIMAGGQLALTQYSPALSTVLSTTLAMAAVFPLARIELYKDPGTAKESPIFEKIDICPVNAPPVTMHEAFMPYYVLVAFSIFVLLTPSVSALFGSWRISFSFPETATGYGFVNKAVNSYSPLAFFTHSGFFLLVSSLAAALFFSLKGLISRKGACHILANTLKKSVPSGVSIIFLLVMSKIMTGSGQIDVLARGTAAATGGYYAILAPMVGAMGSFIASSNVSSNILFGQFQESMAELTHRDTAAFLAAQTGGGAAGTMFSPSKVLLGTTTACIPGAEGELLKKLLIIGLGISAFCGLVTFFGT